jgi:hypothetical protein
MKINLHFERINKSTIFFKCLARLEILMLYYGDNATAEEINKKNEEIRKGDRK